MTEPEWWTTQQAYRDFGSVAGITLPVALLSTLSTLVLVCRRPMPALLMAVSPICTGATLAISAHDNEPVNRDIVPRRGDALPADWEQQRDQWAVAHAACAGLHSVSQTAFLIAGRRDEPDTPLPGLATAQTARITPTTSMPGCRVSRPNPTLMS